MNIMVNLIAKILEKEKHKNRKEKKKRREGRKRDSRDAHLFLKDEVEDTLYHNIWCPLYVTPVENHFAVNYFKSAIFFLFIMSLTISIKDRSYHRSDWPSMWEISVSQFVPLNKLFFWTLSAMYFEWIASHTHNMTVSWSYKI